MSEKLIPTPQCDALSTRICNESSAAQCDDPYVGTAHDWSPEEAYSAAMSLAQKLERECIRLRGELKDMGKEMRESIRDAAAEATWREREDHVERF